MNRRAQPSWQQTLSTHSQLQHHPDRTAQLMFASHNRGKFAELQPTFREIGIDLGFAGEHDLPPVDETGETIEENARIKAVAVATALRCYAVADDTGLFVDALGGAPGVRSARYAGAGATPEAIRALLLSELKNVPTNQRSARFRCVLAISDPSGAIVAEAAGACEGQILEAPAGESHFPYDSLFWLEEHHTTLNLLDHDIRQRVNHRTRALQNLLA